MEIIIYKICCYSEVEKINIYRILSKMNEKSMYAERLNFYDLIIYKRFSKNWKNINKIFDRSYKAN